jgi:16S rRNA (cytosine967-C5)-methyltransferase
MQPNTPNKHSKSTHHIVQKIATNIVRETISKNLKADFVISQQCENLEPFEHAVVEAISMSWLRNRILIENVIAYLCKKKPKQKIVDILYTASADIISSNPNKFAKVVHSWVEFAKKNLSKFESGFINAVLRKVPSAIDEILSAKVGAELLSIKYSHPLWLVEKWIKQFGEKETEQILSANSKNSAVFFRKDFSKQADILTEKYSAFFENTKYSNFLKLKNGEWNNVKNLLLTGHFYVQDPSTFFAPRQFNPKVSKQYLDLCASPGGKSRTIADLINSSNISDQNSLLVSSDLSKRIKPLRENISKIKNIKTAVVECDILSENLADKLQKENLPTEYDGVFIDAPCSNTGVLGRRPDARYRLTENDIQLCAKKQFELLQKAKHFVKVNGLLEYSTCSIEEEENKEVINKFLSENKNFVLKESFTLIPSEENDGASGALFERIA